MESMKSNQKEFAIWIDILRPPENNYSLPTHEFLYNGEQRN